MLTRVVLVLLTWVFVWSQGQHVDYDSWTNQAPLSSGLCRYGNSVECCWGWRPMDWGRCQPHCQQGCKHGECVAPDRCRCHPGYTGKACNQDLNECGVKPRPCKHRCMNTPGSFKCYCLDGYALQPDGSCRNARTCYHANCQYGCEVIKGAVRCTCPSPGLRLGPDGRTCVDVDECSTGGGVCPRRRKCVNTFGSFVCKCHLGFKLTYINGRYSCIDKDSRPFCVLNPSSPKCKCKDGGCKAVPKVTLEPNKPRTTKTTTPITTTAATTISLTTATTSRTTIPLFTARPTTTTPTTTRPTTTRPTTTAPKTTAPTTTAPKTTAPKTTAPTTTAPTTTTPTTTAPTTTAPTTTAPTATAPTATAPTTTAPTTTAPTTTTPTTTTPTTTTIITSTLLSITSTALPRTTSTATTTTVPTTSTLFTVPTTTPVTTTIPSTTPAATTTNPPTTTVTTTPSTTTATSTTSLPTATAPTSTTTPTATPAATSLVTSTVNNRINKDVTHRQRGDVHIPRHPGQNQVWEFDIELGNTADDARDDPEVAALRCTFDHGLCDWTSDREGDVHWETVQSPAGGRYLSVPELKGGQRSIRGARLAVQIVPPWSQGELCFSFSHWLTGHLVGVMQLYVRRAGQDQRYGPALWSRTGGHGWRHTQVTLTTADKILLRAERRRGWRGKMAVDDVTLRQGACR